MRALDFSQILHRLAEHASFSLGRELALRLRPTTDEEEVKRRQQETTEARSLLEMEPHFTVGGAKDLRPHLKKAAIDSPLTPGELLDIRDNMASGVAIRRRLYSLRRLFPTLAEIAQGIEGCSGLLGEIRRSINDRGEVIDGASPALARIRRELHQVHERLLSKMERIASSPENVPFLQEPMVTQRSGRYVIPLKADFKGRIPGVVHDQSASGATLFVEPLATLELNNQWRELQLAEEKERERILKGLTARVAEEIPAIEETLKALASLDLALAKGRYSASLSCVEPRFIPFRPPKGDFLHPGSTLRLIQARHPLLPPEEVVPIDIHISDDFFILVITGPNTGGKTVSLKTAGLTVLMAQSGLHIPAQEAELSIFQGVYADIGDEQSIEQSLSTFSSHLTNIVTILARANERCLVLLDELGAGTDPVEGSALARAILDHLRHRKITSFVATHYSELKSYAHITPGVENASVEFDLETLAPTYVMNIGLPGRSNALAIATRLGLDEGVVREARRLISREDLEVEGYLEDIRRARQEALTAAEAAKEARKEAERKERELAEELKALEGSRREVINEARKQGRRELKEAREEIRRLAAEARKKPRSVEVEARLTDLEEKLQPLPPLKKGVPLGELKVGETVWVEGLGKEGEVVGLEGDQVEVQVGPFRVKADIEDLAEGGTSPRERAPGSTSLPLSQSVPDYLELRGEKAEEALWRLDKYLDDAFLSGLSSIRIVHGKGKGTLRRVVRQAVESHPLVASYRSGEADEGGDGVTVVRLVES
ncbi:MAG: endonuclease MutS2 [Anaerolineae bacterium]